MPPPKGPIWNWFFEGNKQNTTHFQAHCLGCLRNARQADGIQDPPNDTDAALKGRLLQLDFGAPAFVQIRANAGHVLGEKSAMIAHLIGGKVACPYASDAAKQAAKALKKGKSTAAASDSEEEHPRHKKRKKVFRDVDKAMKQPELKVYRGANIPFSWAELDRIQEQFLRATVSTNLPFRWTEDVEVIKLFLMFRSTACNVIPSRDVISGKLLNAAHAEVEEKLREALDKKFVVLSTDGWKDDSRNPITGVNVSTGGKSYLVDLIQSNGHKKDGEAMCAAFEEMIDNTERKYWCIVILFCCDNDGGAQRGRKNLGNKRPWILIVCRQYRHIGGELSRFPRISRASSCWAIGEIPVPYPCRGSSAKMLDGTGTAPVARVPWNRAHGNGRQPYPNRTGGSAQNRSRMRSLLQVFTFPVNWYVWIGTSTVMSHYRNHTAHVHADYALSSSRRRYSIYVHQGKVSVQSLFFRSSIWVDLLLLFAWSLLPSLIVGKNDRWVFVSSTSPGIKAIRSPSTSQASLPPHSLATASSQTLPSSPPMDSFTATIPTKQVEDIVLPPVNEDGGGGTSGSCVVCKEDTSLPPTNEDGGGGTSGSCIIA
ncbi:hypothetical protein B0H12DRAFT_1073385 [Mycena haematopus]|nr:hypothetical protein B0H12DRAFT_1073385 [Mycena haematopus]